jgi:ABC-2 type transport system permease protein
VFAQIITRLLVVMIQITLLVGCGIVLLDLQFVGSLAEMFLVGIVGAFVFLGMGFAIAGVSRSEDQVAPLANIVAMPMVLLSGVFFSRSALPDVLRGVTEFLPLTYFADSMRSIAIDGASLTEVSSKLFALAIWGIITCGLAIKLFRWE